MLINRVINLQVTETEDNKKLFKEYNEVKKNQQVTQSEARNRLARKRDNEKLICRGLFDVTVYMIKILYFNFKKARGYKEHKYTSSKTRTVKVGYVVSVFLRKMLSLTKLRIFDSIIKAVLKKM